jgi:hypothetical protein
VISFKCKTYGGEEVTVTHNNLGCEVETGFCVSEFTFNGVKVVSRVDSALAEAANPGNHDTFRTAEDFARLEEAGIDTTTIDLSEVPVP